MYKYGIFHVNRDLTIEVVGEIDHIRSCRNYFKDITAFANAFDSTFTYLFVHYEKTNTDLRYCDIEIEDVLNLFPLDYEAKTMLEEDFGSQIRFEAPLWADAIEQFKIAQKVSDCQKGVKNLWKIYELDDKCFAECKSIIPDGIIETVVEQKFKGIRPIGDFPIWVYLLRYERHSMYPNTTLGFYMDAVHAATNFSQLKEFPSIEGSTIFQFLDSLDYDLQTYQIFDMVKKNSDTTGRFLSFASTLIEGYDYMTVATIFFKFKNAYKDSFVYNQKLVEACKKAWPKEFALAMYLLGWILGHENTFDCLYEKLPLRILKKKVRVVPSISQVDTIDVEEPSRPTPIPNSTDAPEAKAATAEPLLPFAQNQGCELLFPITMAQPITRGKNKGQVTKSSKRVVVNTPEEYEDKLSQGWIKI